MRKSGITRTVRTAVATLNAGITVNAFMVIRVNATTDGTATTASIQSVPKIINANSATVAVKNEIDVVVTKDGEARNAINFLEDIHFPSPYVMQTANVIAAVIHPLHAMTLPI